MLKTSPYLFTSLRRGTFFQHTQAQCTLQTRCLCLHRQCQAYVSTLHWRDLNYALFMQYTIKPLSTSIGSLIVYLSVLRAKVLSKSSHYTGVYYVLSYFSTFSISWSHLRHNLLRSYRIFAYPSVNMGWLVMGQQTNGQQVIPNPLDSSPSKDHPQLGEAICANPKCASYMCTKPDAPCWGEFLRVLIYGHITHSKKPPLSVKELSERFVIFLTGKDMTKGPGEGGSTSLVLYKSKATSVCEQLQQHWAKFAGVAQSKTPPALRWPGQNQTRFNTAIKNNNNPVVSYNPPYDVPYNRFLINSVHTGRLHNGNFGLIKTLKEIFKK